MWQYSCIKTALLLLLFTGSSPAAGAESICYGSTSKGKLEHGCKLPYAGDNFSAYSRLGSSLGRTYVHCTISEVVLVAYDDLKTHHPGKAFVYGETGRASAGSFKPHKTHQNGLSVDFMVPVVDSLASPFPCPPVHSTSTATVSTSTPKGATVN